MNKFGTFVAQNQGFFYPLVAILALVVVGAIPISGALVALAILAVLVIAIKLFGTK